MKKSAFVTIFLIGPFLASANALDLTPHPVTTTINNLRVNRYFFEDAGKRMGFRIDNKMTVNGASAAAAFKFDDSRNADMQILKSPKKPEALFGEKELEAYRAHARALLPGNAADVQLDLETSGAIPINGWTSYQFVFSYNLLGLAYRRSVTFLNYNKTEQLIIDVGAPTSVFDSVNLRSYHVLNSLSELKANSPGTT
jgi:hypothetical protein